MALELRPNCEGCDCDLPPNSLDARMLSNVCPNCGGGFAPRPIRPANEWRAGLSVSKRPPSTRRVHLSYSREEIASLAERVRDIPPENR
jgi:hypothetical protein